MLYFGKPVDACLFPSAVWIYVQRHLGVCVSLGGMFHSACMFCSVNCYVVLLMDDGRNLCKYSETQNIEVAVTDYFPK